MLNIRFLPHFLMSIEWNNDLPSNPFPSLPQKQLLRIDDFKWVKLKERAYPKPDPHDEGRSPRRRRKAGRLLRDI